MSQIKVLQRARKEKNDEFYTQLQDIERELVHYWKHFKGKTVLCNCDDPRESNFVHYFLHKFNDLGLKKLIAVCYKNQAVDLFSQSDFEKATWLEYTGEKTDGKIPTVEQIGINYLEGDGDFRSEECIELLKQSDIVVTNPPFSLFLDFISQLVEYDKKFLILGNKNAVAYKDIFPLIMNNKIWLGNYNGTMTFSVPSHYEARDCGTEIDDNGVQWRKLGFVCWFTNLEHDKRKNKMALYCKYNPEIHLKYDNYDAINVDKIKDIPYDYDGVMGVPVTFLDNYNPEQFEIVGVTEKAGEGYSFGLWDASSREKCCVINGKNLFKRIFIKRKG